MIQLEDVSVRYGQDVVLRDVSLAIHQGECVLITGPTGCGKSTLAHVLAGLIPHAMPARMTGRASVAGLDVGSSSMAELACHVGTVFQNPSAHLFHLRVEDEVAFGLRNVGCPEAEIAQRVDWALSAVGLQGMHDVRPGELSGGQMQRLAIASALAMRPKVLVLDEPMASLDVPGTRRVMATLANLHRELGMTIVLIEHRLAEAARLADRMIVLREGQVLEDGDPGDVLRQSTMVRDLGLRRPAFEPASDWEPLLEPNGRPPEGLQPLLWLEGVHAGYGKSEVLRGVDLCIYRGEFVALVGDNGSGKSTLALVAAGLLKPSAGCVRMEGGRRPRGGLDVSLLFQNPAHQLLTDRVEDEVALGPLNYGVFRSEAHLEMLRWTDLLHLRDRNPSSLSAGQQQRTALAACLALRPRLVVLDEPTLGQDWGHMEQIMSFLKKLNAQGAAVLLITHDYKLVHRFSERVVLLRNGSIVLDGRIREGRDGSAKRCAA